MIREHRNPVIVFLGAVIATVMALAAAGVLWTVTIAHEADGHPVRIHEGSCEATGAAADRLPGVGATVSLEGTPIPVPATIRADAAAPIQASTTTIRVAFAHLTEEPHAIVVYESDEAMDHTIACGNVGGPMTEKSGLIVWLAPTNGSAATGIALLSDEGGTTTAVTIFLAEGLSGAGTTGGDAHDTPEATPSD
jgi:hypothetical protein